MIDICKRALQSVIRQRRMSDVMTHLYVSAVIMLCSFI